MTSRTYTIVDADEIPYEVEMIRTYKGRPATGPSYSSAGEPAEPPEFEVVSIHPKPPNAEAEGFIIDEAYEKAFDDNWDETWDDHLDYMEKKP